MYLQKVARNDRHEALHCVKPKWHKDTKRSKNKLIKHESTKKEKSL